MRKQKCKCLLPGAWGRGWVAHIFFLLSFPSWCIQSPSLDAPEHFNLTLSEISLPQASGLPGTIMFYMSCNVKSYNGKTEDTQLILLNCLFLLYVLGRAEICSGTKFLGPINMAGPVHHVCPPWALELTSCQSDSKFEPYSTRLFGEYESEQWRFPSGDAHCFSSLSPWNKSFMGREGSLWASEKPEERLHGRLSYLHWF